jgi:hypothetical protein
VIDSSARRSPHERSLQIPHAAIAHRLTGIVVFPVAEIVDDTNPNDAINLAASIGISQMKIDAWQAQTLNSSLPYHIERKDIPRVL